MKNIDKWALKAIFFTSFLEKKNSNSSIKSKCTQTMGMDMTWNSTVSVSPGKFQWIKNRANTCTLWILYLIVMMFIQGGLRRRLVAWPSPCLSCCCHLADPPALTGLPFLVHLYFLDNKEKNCFLFSKLCFHPLFIFVYFN